jgi:hypothetical protein
MLSQDIRELLIQVITSWQVLAATGVLILYVFLVNFVSRLYRHNRPAPMSASGKTKKAAGSPEAVPEQTDDLGLEEKKEE